MQAFCRQIVVEAHETKNGKNRMKTKKHPARQEAVTGIGIGYQARHEESRDTRHGHPQFGAVSQQ